jgi:hypothetical protein
MAEFYHTPVMIMKEEEQLALAEFYAKWETSRLVDAVTIHATVYAPQALKIMAKEIEKRGASGPEVESFMNSQLFSVPVNGHPELAGKESGTVGRQSVAKPWWFLIPLPAVLVTYVVVSLCHMSEQSTGGPDRLAVFLMFAGIAFFPVGLFTFILPRSVLAFPGIVVLTFLGYALYLAVIIWGCSRPSLKLFFVLCGLLFLNIAGCHMLGQE